MGEEVGFPKLEVVSIKRLLGKELIIPDYQRPYKWTTTNVNKLIDDLIYFSKHNDYRLGTVVLHKEDENLNVVDGQQRCLTMAMILHCLGSTTVLTGPNTQFSNKITQKNIYANYQAIVSRKAQLESIKDFIYKKCNVLVITLSDISEAFQFFDSQNSRGKTLYPHDLLKAYHLRLVKEDQDIRKILAYWEGTGTPKLHNIFRTLYRCKEWANGNLKFEFSKEERNIFKGFTLDKILYPYQKALAIAYLSYSDSTINELTHGKKWFPFSMNQDIINGKPFFERVEYYHQSITDIEQKKLGQISDETKKLVTALSVPLDERESLAKARVYRLFCEAMLSYIDKFGEDSIEEATRYILKWATNLLFAKSRIPATGVIKYLREKDNVFKNIKEANSPIEFMSSDLTIYEGHKKEKHQTLAEELWG